MDWTVPAFAHLPLIHGPDGAKLSKRHGAQAVSEFADMGYLPEAMRNYLARLGWGHGDAEIFSDAQAIAWFDVKDAGTSPARLDWAKLNHVNQHYIRAADDDRLTALTQAIHAKRGLIVGDDVLPRLRATIALVKDGAQTLLQLADLTLFVVTPRPVTIPDKGQKLLTDETVSRLQRLRDRLAAPTVTWTVDALLAELRAFSESEGVGLGKFGPALRAVLGGEAAAPDLASALAALDRNESLARLDDAL
jgi:glutamyl-tRNA synthetase